MGKVVERVFKANIQSTQISSSGAVYLAYYAIHWEKRKEPRDQQGV